MADRLAGLRRYAWWDGRAAAHCKAPGCWENASGKYGAVTRWARGHTRKTGHPTRAEATRLIRYEPDGDSRTPTGE